MLAVYGGEVVHRGDTQSCKDRPNEGIAGVLPYMLLAFKVIGLVLRGG